MIFICDFHLQCFFANFLSVDWSVSSNFFGLQHVNILRRQWRRFVDNLCIRDTMWEVAVLISRFLGIWGSFSVGRQAKRSRTFLLLPPNLWWTYHKRFKSGSPAKPGLTSPCSILPWQRRRVVPWTLIRLGSGLTLHCRWLYQSQKFVNVPTKVQKLGKCL